MTEQKSLTPLKTLLFAFHVTNALIIFLPVYLNDKLNYTQVDGY
ncbi:hypothetical protein [Tenuibacillus multivorans]|uniref:MFS transporter, PPP family, 3-phenylpropionic acid transporter n=1 Tax=Tenuibacillus multivorans TaxID=237069 RepID=A0A1H0DYG0_9BACI|nr:hypothetical protein [Tenuibacillus multivorans]GEL76728.1 hypothetical protein TMU01_09630 [Tenuibacillus multivorans]SDN75155.1 MFS transporter, PPP family, 3-phenylpropionic acid transporter [Tenuibacillus multivorans]